MISNSASTLSLCTSSTRDGGGPADAAANRFQKFGLMIHTLTAELIFHISDMYRPPPPRPQGGKKKTPNITFDSINTICLPEKINRRKKTEEEVNVCVYVLVFVHSEDKKA